MSFEIKLLSKTVSLGHMGDNLASAIILNSDFTYLNSIAVIVDNDFIIFKISIVVIMNNDFTIFSYSIVVVMDISFSIIIIIIIYIKTFFSSKPFLHQNLFKNY